jgi:hypothetical protein
VSALAIVELEVGDAPDAWRAAGFTVDDEGVSRVGTVRIRCVGGERRGLLAWRVRAVDGVGTVWAAGAACAVGAVDGLATTVVDEPLAVADVHRNLATFVDHVVVATPDVDRTIGAFRAVGSEARRERLTGTRERPMRQVFLRAGEVIIEVVGPPEPPEDPQRACAPAPFWGLACTVSDLDCCAARLGDVLGSARDAVQPGRRIATLRHERVGISVPFAFMS